MPKYRITTDGGVYEVTTGDAETPFVPQDRLAQGRNSAATSGQPEGTNAEQSTMGGLIDALTPLAHPQSAGDLLGLAIPSGAGAAVATKMLEPVTQAVGRYGGAVADLATALLPPSARRAVGVLRELNPTTWKNPLTVAGREEPQWFKAQPANQTPMSAAPEPQWFKAQPANQTPMSAAAPPPPEVASGLSSAQRVDLAKQGFKPDLIDRIEQRGTLGPVRGKLRAIEPLASHEPPPESPLRQPRIDIGAERVARGQGMDITDVRKQAGPVVGEEAGTASPILPEEALKRIVDKLKALPPGGPEREAYVQAATSGKARGQVENIRRTLEHLGLLVPATAGLASVKDQLLERMRAR